MAVQDLRDFFAVLEKNGKVDKISKEVTISEIPVVMRQKEKEAKTVLFENIAGYKNKLFNNILGGRDFLALAFGCSREDVIKEYMKRAENPIETKMVAEGPVQEKIFTGDDVDIKQFPFIVHSAKDAGRYITAGMVIVRDPETGVRNVSINRMQLKGPNKIGVRMMPPQHLGVIYEKAEKMDKPLEVAVAIGNHPLDLVAAVTSPPFGVDELTIAGGLRGEPLEMVKCKTIDLEVPARAELVIEGVLYPREREKEGPFGDFMGYYVPVMENHVMHIKAITMRQDPLLQVIKAGSIEDTHLLALSREAQVYRAVAGTNAKIKALSLCPMIFTCAISIEKQFEEEAKNVIMAAFGSYSWLKTCIVVDHDVDAFDPVDVWWAVSTRMRPDKGVIVIPNAVGFPRDPHKLHQSKLGIDATVPMGNWDEYERITVPLKE